MPKHLFPPFKRPRTGLSVLDAEQVDLPARTADTRQPGTELGFKRADGPSGPANSIGYVFGVFPQDKAGYLALFDGELQALRFLEVELPGFADHGGYAFAFKRFFSDPEHIFFALYVDKNDTVRADAEAFEGRWINAPRIAGPDADATVFEQDLHQTREEAADGGCLFGAAADEFVQNTRRKHLAGKVSFNGAKSEAFGFAGFWRTEAFPTADVLPELFDDFLF